MRLPVSLLLAATLLMPALGTADTIVYVTRHGEKADTSKDPALSARGQARARTIATILKQAGITQVFATATVRAQQTAQPTAAQAGVAIQTYDGKGTPIADKLKTLSGNTLLVGHSNTIVDLVKQLGGTAEGPVPEEEFDRLYQVAIGADGKVRTVLLTSVVAAD